MMIHNQGTQTGSQPEATQKSVPDGSVYPVSALQETLRFEADRQVSGATHDLVIEQSSSLAHPAATGSDSEVRTPHPKDGENDSGSRCALAVATLEGGAMSRELTAAEKVLLDIRQKHMIDERGVAQSGADHMIEVSGRFYFNLASFLLSCLKI
jgi:hypothetical protein